MARIRTVKPEFFRHYGLYEAEVESGFPLRLAFEGLWTAADREGRFKWKPAELKLDCLPYDDVDFSRVLDALATRGFIVKYTIAGVDYGYIPSFLDHQSINGREAESKLPEPPQDIENIEELTHEARVDDAPATCHMHARGEGKGKEGKGRERKGRDNTADGGYRFEGDVIRLRQKDFDNWREKYHAIPDLVAELQRMDDYYGRNLSEKDRKNWFIRCSNALAKKHQALIRGSPEVSHDPFT